MMEEDCSGGGWGGGSILLFFVLVCCLFSLFSLGVGYQGSYQDAKREKCPGIKPHFTTICASYRRSALFLALVENLSVIGSADKTRNLCFLDCYYLPQSATNRLSQDDLTLFST